MHLPELARAVAEHSGHLVCDHSPTQSKQVTFCHLVTAPEPLDMALPNIGRLRDFYDTFGSVVFYHAALSNDAAFRLAPPSAWAELADDFSDWVELAQEQVPERLPDWIEDCLVIGEVPRTINYLLMPTTGPQAGWIFLFDHDGIEITPLAPDLVGMVQWLLNPDQACLRQMREHMRFVTDDPMVQWLLREIHDARGLVIGFEKY